ncbi:MAG: glycine dehydrogenase [Saprospiraceae bacterium]|jgi:glycine dehydrogenase
MAFSNRHIGPNQSDKIEMLKTVGYNSMEELISDTIPADIRLKTDIDVPKALSEEEWIKEVMGIAKMNTSLKTLIGQGYYNTHTPSVILRNVFENPGWYTAYTPYQAEISQGRLEALLNFQTLTAELTGMPLANASLLDEATAAAEAMIMLFNCRKRDAVKRGANKFFVDIEVFAQTIDVVQTRADFLGIEIVLGDALTYEIDEQYFGVLVQYPNSKGEVVEYSSLSKKINECKAELVVATDLLSLCVLVEPAKFGAGIVLGNSQRFGVPMGFGGPHAAFFATKESFKRNIPGRIIGVSKDAEGKVGLRMALQTREQHIKREKATSNICTAQALLATMASMFAVFHGPKRLIKIATTVANRAKTLGDHLIKLGVEVSSKDYFDTVCVVIEDKRKLQTIAKGKGYNFNYHFEDVVTISVDETTSFKDIKQILDVFSQYQEKMMVSVSQDENDMGFNECFARESLFLQQDVFNKYHSETEMMRYLKSLENKDLSLVHSMIALGSCTMKLNAASQMIPLSWEGFNAVHPFVPVDQSLGYQQVIKDLAKALKVVTGFDGISFQPNSGAQGELAGLMVIKAYLRDKGEGNRNVVIIPSSAHGTNPASAVMAGFKVVVTKCDEEGNIDFSDLKDTVEQHSTELAALMITYPSTHGVYEEGINKITELIHSHGAQVYMDGANMNAQVGLTNPAQIGADVCHLNLHKTFAIPHGGGGPGMGPIGVAKHLTPFLPKHLAVSNDEKAIGPVSAAPYSSALILLISLGYVKMLGAEGLKEATEMAILNANYLKVKLEKRFNILYQGKNNTVAHEMIVDCRPFKESAGIEVMDIAKRLIDYGFHSPTVSFPVVGTLMVEPTESESKEELDRFVDAMISIVDEIEEIAKGIYPKDDNVLINAPHPADTLMTDDWQHSYSRQKAAYPLTYLKTNKYWVPVSRIDNAYGDRNLICTCPDVMEYAGEES